MKKNILFAAAVMLLAVVNAFAGVDFDGNYKNPDTAVVKNTFKAVFPNLDFARADGIAQKIREETGVSFVLDETAVEAGKQFYKTFDNSAVCKIDRKTGDVFFRQYKKFEGSATGLPSKGNAAGIAKKYLQSLGLFKKEMGDAVINTLKEAVYDGKTSRTYEKMRIVTFTRKLGGIPVRGASRAAVMLGANGELVGLVVRWMDVQPEKIKGKIPKTLLKKHIKTTLEARKIESDVKIKKAGLIIFDDGEGTLEPMLHLEGEIITAHGNFFSDWMVPVIEK